MKIILLSHTGEVTGGAEQCLLEYVDVLSGRGHKCKVIVPYKGAMTRVLTEKKIAWKVVGFGWATKPHRRVNENKLSSSTGNSIAYIFHEVERYKPDLIITNTSVIPWGLYAGRAFSVPTMLLVHEVLTDKDPSLRMMPSDEGYLNIINENTDYIIYNSRFVEGEFSHIVTRPKASETILYPLPPFDAKKIDAHYKENVIQKTVKIAVIGALSNRKNQIEALEAAKILTKNGVDNFVINLYGSKADIRYTKQLRMYIRDNNLSKRVKIKGFAQNIYDEMNDHNIVLSTSKYEPFGRTIIEGQLFGRVVITNNTGGGVELVENGVNGLVYTLGKPEQLAKKIQWVLENKEKAIGIANHAKSIQFKKYINDSRYDALIGVVESLANEKRVFGSEDIYNPTLTLFRYNQQLMHRYRHLYRVTHNKVTRGLKRGVKKGRAVVRTAVLKVKP